MKNVALIKGGVVENVVLVDADEVVDLADSGAWIGWIFVGGVFTPPPAPEPAPVAPANVA